MNSFESLQKNIRFRNEIAGKHFYYNSDTAIVAEMQPDPEAFVEKRKHFHRHIGFELNPDVLEKVLQLHSNPARYISLVDDTSKKHMGFVNTGIEKIKVLLNYCYDKEKFLFHKDCYGKHLGFYASPKTLKFLLTQCENPRAFLEAVSNDGKTLLFGNNWYRDVINVVLENHPDPDAYFNIRDKDGKHAGFGSSLESLEIMIKNCKDPVAFVNAKNLKGEHMGFRAPNCRIELLLKYCGGNTDAFVSSKNLNGEHMGFYCKSRDSLASIISCCKDPESFVLQRNIQGLTLAFKAGEEQFREALSHCVGKEEQLVSGTNMYGRDIRYDAGYEKLKLLMFT